MRGNKGELAAIPLSDRAERLKRVYVNQVPLEIERIWKHGGHLVFKFVGVDSIGAAQAFEKSDVCIPIEERVSLPEGEFYQSDLIGCEVWDVKSGRLLGVIEDWQEHGGPPLLEVKDEHGREVLIPFAKAICIEIDVPGRRVVVDIPEGLDEL